MSARDRIHSELMRLGVHTSIAWPLSGRSDADRLALARALVPECAVVPREPTPEMCSMGADELPTPTCESTDEEAAAEVYRAMLAASEPQP